MPNANLLAFAVQISPIFVERVDLLPKSTSKSGVGAFVQDKTIGICVLS